MKQNRQNQLMTDAYFELLYKTLYQQIKKTASSFISKNHYYTVDDYIQIGFMGILEEKEGLPFGYYQSRAKSRMIDHYRRLNLPKNDLKGMADLANAVFARKDDNLYITI